MPAEQAPQDLQLERALLALVLTDNGVLDRVTRLEPEHFFDAVNREVFTVARELRRDGKPVDLVTLGGLMGGNPLGGADSILDSIKSYSMGGELPDAISVEDSLVNLYTRRRMLAAGEALSGSVLNYAAKPADVIETTVRDLEDIRAISQPARRTLWDVDAGIDAMLREMDADIDAKCQKPTKLHSGKTALLRADVELLNDLAVARWLRLTLLVVLLSAGDRLRWPLQSDGPLAPRQSAPLVKTPGPTRFAQQRRSLRHKRGWPQSIEELDWSPSE
jgi:hypothetical protein